MAQASQNQASTTPRIPGESYLFGVPLGKLGWFATLLMSASAGMAAFFASTFCGIVFVLFYNSALHGTIDYAISYKWIGLPVGSVVLVVALVYLGMLWIRRRAHRA